MNQSTYLILALILLAAAVVALVAARRLRAGSGVPTGRVVYDDSGAIHRLEKPLYDPLMNLVGKPDYLVEQEGRLVPVEVKSSYAPSQPYDSHVMQLAAYCRLVEVFSGKRPPHGILRYRNRSVAIDFTPELSARLADLVDDIRLDERRGNVPRSHQVKGRCTSCGYRSHCDQKLP